MTHVSRNARCPCGSGKRYKHCCGSYAADAPPRALRSPEELARIQLELSRHEAREHQRRLMQGLGRPIVSFENQGYRFVAIGKELRWSRAWRTFPDFLFDYIKFVLTPEWGNAELTKPETERHPLIGWYKKVCEFQQARLAGAAGRIREAPMTGAVKAYLGLAYDLYLCAHNAELPELLIKRLRNAQSFEGAVYEAYVIGNMAKAGFRIEFEDETDSTRSHCEFTATHQETGRKFCVEAKAVSSTSKRAGTGTAPPRIRGKLFDALLKQADHERIVFIELNRAEVPMVDGMPTWAQLVDAEIEQAEKDATTVPPAYVFVTNRGFMHALDSQHWTEIGLACGFKIFDFASRKGATSILDLAKARERHVELHWLRKALHTHRAIPNTFDDRLPEDSFAADSPPRLLIGTTYAIPDDKGAEVLGVLTDGAVLEPEQAAYGTYRLEDGRHIICRSPLTEAELQAYRCSPDTFFGTIKEVSKEIAEPLDCYDFHWRVYSRASKETLLAYISGWPDYAAFKDIDQRELARIYCARMAEPMWLMHLQSKTRKMPPDLATAPITVGFRPRHRGR